MELSNDNLPPQRIVLAEGAQAVINGALVTALAPCTIEVGAGAFVLSGRALSVSNPLRNPREELYFSALEAGTDAARFDDARFRLFNLLAQVVAHEPSYQGQRECAACAAALMAGNADDTIRSAARLASERLAEPRGERFGAVWRSGSRRTSAGAAMEAKP
ncbi:hypothetical protein [Erythrobacter sp. JK5]|uniref:hypothetical protein n=1 Tax=Erythrobacter sp. JK5 TaxID=2829500 RepID=UPI001BABAB44|nr:hypothetical protein [Erythrobacter sp. JK5]QUL37369.1 hypothetical protein KDC96_13515 [Erythrobacter sp. JK5]